jgi:hypothetical protein
VRRTALPAGCRTATENCGVLELRHERHPPARSKRPSDSRSECARHDTAHLRECCRDGADVRQAAQRPPASRVSSSGSSRSPGSRSRGKRFGSAISARSPSHCHVRANTAPRTRPRGGIAIERTVECRRDSDVGVNGVVAIHLAIVEPVGASANSAAPTSTLAQHQVRQKRLTAATR